MPGLRFLVALLRGIERLFQRGELPAQRADLLVQHLDLGQRPRREAASRGSSALAEFGGLALRVGWAGGREAVIRGP